MRRHGKHLIPHLNQHAPFLRKLAKLPSFFFVRASQDRAVQTPAFGAVNLSLRLERRWEIRRRRTTCADCPPQLVVCDARKTEMSSMRATSPAQARPATVSGKSLFLGERREAEGWSGWLVFVEVGGAVEEVEEDEVGW